MVLLIKKVEAITIARGKVLNQVQQQDLNLRFTDDNLKIVVFYSSCFFKRSWHIVGQDVIDVVQDIFRHGKILKEINISTITLIPKITSSASVGDFRLIACYSVIYKVILSSFAHNLVKFCHILSLSPKELS